VLPYRLVDVAAVSSKSVKIVDAVREKERWNGFAVGLQVSPAKAVIYVVQELRGPRQQVARGAEGVLHFLEAGTNVVQVSVRFLHVHVVLEAFDGLEINGWSVRVGDAFEILDAFDDKFCDKLGQGYVLDHRLIGRISYRSVNLYHIFEDLELEPWSMRIVAWNAGGHDEAEDEG
jgi:hypothetical protein